MFTALGSVTEVLCVYVCVCVCVYSEFRKKMELARSRFHILQKKQKDTEKMAIITGHADKRWVCMAPTHGAVSTRLYTTLTSNIVV